MWCSPITLHENDFDVGNCLWRVIRNGGKGREEGEERGESKEDEGREREIL